MAAIVRTDYLVFVQQLLDQLHSGLPRNVIGPFSSSRVFCPLRSWSKSILDLEVGDTVILVDNANQLMDEIVGSNVALMAQHLLLQSPMPRFNPIVGRDFLARLCVERKKRGVINCNSQLGSIIHVTQQRVQEALPFCGTQPIAPHSSSTTFSRCN